MTEYSCSMCDYRSFRKDALLTHINRKTKCGEGDPIIIEIPYEIKCKYCKKEFTTKKTLDRHCKERCKAKMSDLSDKIRDLEEQLEMAKQEIAKKEITCNNQTINIDNSIKNYIVVLNGYSDTDVSKLKDKHFLKAINKMILSVPTMIKDVHFNPDIPENQNIYISNMRNGYVMVYNSETKNWDARPKGEMIEKLINDREYDIQEWLGEGEKYPKAMEKFNEYLEKKEEDGVQKTIKDEIELLLYNNRSMITNKK